MADSDPCHAGSKGSFAIQVTWFEAQDFVTVVVNRKSDNAYWTVSLPRVASAITRTTCYGMRSQCPLASNTPCNNVNLGTSSNGLGLLSDNSVRMYFISP